MSLYFSSQSIHSGNEERRLLHKLEHMLPRPKMRRSPYGFDSYATIQSLMQWFNSNLLRKVHVGRWWSIVGYALPDSVSFSQSSAPRVALCVPRLRAENH